MSDPGIAEIDKSLEIAELIRAGEAGYARDYRVGTAFGDDADRQRLDAFTLGLLDALAGHISARYNRLRLMVYLHKLLKHGPGRNARRSLEEMCNLQHCAEFARYVSGGRSHAARLLTGSPPDVGRFAQLMTQELEGS